MTTQQLEQINELLTELNQVTPDPVRDLQFMQMPAEWPNTVLPLRNFTRETDPLDWRNFCLGWLEPSAGPVVHVGCIFLDRGTDHHLETYPTFEALLADGWHVD